MPASFRSYLGSMGYNSIICYPSFNNASIDACPQSRIEKLSNSIDSLNPFEENRDVFATSVLADSVNLHFDSEGRISIPNKLLDHAKIKQSMLLERDRSNNEKPINGGFSKICGSSGIKS